MAAMDPKPLFIKVILPYIIASVGFLLFYSFLNWVLVIQLKLIEPANMIFEFYISAVISALIVLLYLRKKIAEFKIEDKARWGI